MNVRLSIRALILSGALLIIALPSAAFASEVRNGAAAVVAPGETVIDDLFASGQTVTIAGRTLGDVYAAGGTVVVTGTVDGDLIAAAQQVVVDGDVVGNVRAAGAVVTVNGHVGHSVTSVAQQVNISSGGRVDGSLVAAAETISAFGTVGRGLTIGGGTIQLGGPVGGKVTAWAENLSLGPNTRVAGDLEYYSERPAAIAGGAVAGQVQYHAVQREQRQEPVLNGLFDFGGLLWLAGSALLGALALILAPRAAARATELGRQQPFAAFGIGLLTLFAVPIVIVLVGITLVGIPLALTTAAVYWVGLMLAWPALGLVVGTELARRTRRTDLPVLGALAVGLIVLHLVTHLPVIGGLVAFLGLAFGLGLIVQSIRRWRRAAETPVTQTRVAVPA